MADGTIGIDEPTTIDLKLDTESLTVGANTVQRERIQIAGATALQIAPVDATNGLSVAVVPALPAGTNAIGKLAANSGVDIGDVDVLSIAAGDNNIGNVDIVTLPSVTIGTFPDNEPFNVAQVAGATTSVGVGASGTGTQRVVQANDAGKTLVATGGSASSSGNNTLVAAGTAKLKVYAFSLTTTSTTAVTCIFQSGASGTELWRVILQAPSNVNTGANLSVTPPAYLFATASATLLNLNLSGAITVHWSVAYFDEA